MILLLPFSEKSHSIKDSESQIYNIHFSLNNETLILLYSKKKYMRARMKPPCWYIVNNKKNACFLKYYQYLCILNY